MTDSSISVSFVDKSRDDKDDKDDELKGKGKEEMEDVEGAQAPYIATIQEGYEALRRWEIIRHSKEIHEKAVTDQVLQNMVDRIESGRGVCQDLYKYFKELASVERSYTKDIFKVDFIRNTLDKKQVTGSLLTTLVALEKQNMATCTVYEEHVNTLIDDIVVKTTSLRSDYENQTSMVLSSAKKLAKDIEQHREDVVKNFTNYCSAFEEQQAAERKGTASEKDAWMEEQKYHQSIVVLRSELAKYTVEMGRVFEKFLALEEGRIETTKMILQHHTNKQKLMFTKLIEKADEVGQTEIKIDPVADRQTLVADKFNRADISTRIPLSTMPPALAVPVTSSSSSTSTTSTLSQKALRRRSSSLKQLVRGSSSSSLSATQAAASQYFDTPITTNDPTWDPDRPPRHLLPEQTGLLWRQSSIVKSWKKNYFLLTSGGHVHIYGSEQDKLPEHSISLGSATLQHLSNYEEDNVMELIVKPGSFFSSARYLIKADSREQMEQWLNAMKKYIISPKK
eukprot:TRINITY_DN2232_c0_g2_i1.p1 TRINITY_DN2232_c0_g2~~TRINITY_DN2232_c0_g2_i1.p1  ORF type:complete len:532 (-),score=124.95 TRINITY_DN2232_c0_g2_i1:81-1607(-)